MVPYTQIDPGAPLAAAFGSVGNTLAQKLIGLGGFVGLTTVVLILLMSQPRIWFAMARDGLLFPWFARVHPRFRTPFNAQILTGAIAGLMAAAVPLADLHHMVSIGTLFAFVVVSASVLIMRYKNPGYPEQSVNTVLLLALGLSILCFGVAHDFNKPFQWLGQTSILLEPLRYPIGIGSVRAGLLQLLLILSGSLLSLVMFLRLCLWKSTYSPSTFKCPAVPFIPVIAMAANLYMMVNLNADAWIRLWVWLAAGLVIYTLYGRKHSKLSR
jgi:APA family basic amino acid/polyamine antiporter